MAPEFSYSLTLVEELLWIVEQKIGMPQYDFAFEQFFACRHPYRREETIRAIARSAALTDYGKRYETLRSDGIELIHTPLEYERTSVLPTWYPLLEDLTPRSIWFDRRPSLSDIESTFKWPVFIKGERQTNKHQRRLSILEGPEDFSRLMEAWEADPILWWQRVVCREYIPLRLVGEQSAETMPRAFEFRTFWWKSACVGIGPYWKDEHYALTPVERDIVIAIAGEAARRIGVTFLVVDMAQTAVGKWIVIECNDGQDSGYAGVAPMLMWRRILEEETKNGKGSQFH